MARSITGFLQAIARHREATTGLGGSVVNGADGRRTAGRFFRDRHTRPRGNAGEISRHGIILVLLSVAFGWPAHAQTQQVETHGGQSPAITTTTGNVAVNYGFTAEQVQDLIRAARAGDEDKIADLSSKLDVTQGAAITMLRIIGQQDVPFEKLPQKLREVAQQYKSAMARLAALDPHDPITRDLVTAADAAIKSGRLDEAEQLMRQATRAEVVAAQQAQELVRQAQAAAEQRLLRAAADSEVVGNIAMTQLDYLDAAQNFQEAADLVPAGHPDEKGRFLVDKAEALYRHGDERGDNAVLANSIAAYDAALPELARDRVPLQWAMTQNGLGNALERLGERESGTSRLKQAVAAYRAALGAVAPYYAALEEDTHDRFVWIDWAMIQMNLGSALTTVGQRENGTAHLQEAVVAYRAALAERSRERVPLDWAMTQNNLGCALLRLAEREGSAARLEEAVAAYRAALEERTRERVPLDWAMTQNNLANALLELGEREDGAARLEEAVVTYRLALQERTQDRVPLQWAETENNLGAALWRLGERNGETARLEEAIVAYQLALQERTRERVPLEWAMTQHNLGMALKTLGERQSGTARLEEAVVAYHAALEEYTPDRLPLQWAQTQMNLGNALLRLGEREDGTAQLEQAVAVYRRALERDPMPIDQANIEFNMGIALTDLGKKTTSMDSLKEALLCFRQACAVFREMGMLQLSIPCNSAISPLQKDLEPDAPSTGQPSKPSG